MLRGLNEIRGTLYVTILTLIVTGLVVPCANARRQSSPKETPASTDAAAAPQTPTKKTTTHHTTSTSAHNTSPSSSSKPAPASASSHHPTRRSSRKSRTKRVRGQQKIDSERATSIEEALIREHYLSGEPSGVWDQATENAMRRYQSDHGWQTKEVPDSRALIKLGLGPNNDHLLNPDSAMTSSPIARRTEAPAALAHPSTASDSATKSGDPQPSAKPASVPRTTPSGQPAPAAPPKDANDSANPQ